MYVQKKRKQKARENRTGLSDSMKQALEKKVGFSADDVRVYRNSSLPERMGALAVSLGSDIHLGPGNDQYLNHELGHWVQKKIFTNPTSSFSMLFCFHLLLILN